MVEKFNGPYSFDKSVVQNWNNDQGGVYYCGAKTDTNSLIVYYIGKAFGNGGIRTRLLQHLSESKWYDVTHFGYCVCSSENEAFNFEASEIKRFNPKYNTLHRP